MRVIQGRIECPNCYRGLTVEHLLDNCSCSWPDQSWLYFHCPFCEDYSHIEVSNDVIRTGILDGAPGPNFTVHSEKILRDFDVSIKEQSIECFYSEKRFVFRAR